jgi:hypothetical protein
MIASHYERALMACLSFLKQAAGGSKAPDHLELTVALQAALAPRTAGLANPHARW